MFDAFKNLGNMGEMMKKAQALQERMQQMQDELGRKQITAEAAGGMVTATVNGKLQLVKVRIDKTKIDLNDIELLEDVIVAAVSAAQGQAAETVKQEMGKLSSELGLPPGALPG